MRLLTMRAASTAFCAAALVSLPAIASAGVVVSSSGPSAGTFPVGRTISNDERIVLRAGDTLTVLDGNATRVLRGAGTYSLGQSASANRRDAFAVLTERRSARRVRTGAVRAADDGSPVRSPNLWYVDVDRSGTMCLADTERVRLWRRATDDPATYRISAVDSGESQAVSFAEGEMLAPWNTRALPVAAGSAYRLTGDGAASELRFVILDDIAEDPEALARQLIENGCSAQLELLSSAMMPVES